ncbi:hypothetical protein [Salinibacillus xinjiangensis]|uniref:DUF3221 domain-containing protein n=1 Tax=Salinibacillus xinjiangensis TaxID=1229268 RepID=A0A6G1X4Y0_9BACI|nr:hypothetical protein [Salinibacillus xinjiangensis]MRG85997.1 hypothetical protein [Salinibacillus xinjiangensis]
MVKSKLLLFALIFSVIGACSHHDPISSFEGYFGSVNTNNELQFDCSKTAKRNLNTTTEEGYSCIVEVTENTTIKTEDGDVLSVDELKKWEANRLNKRKEAKVILIEEKDINPDKESREGLKASEIIILN